MQKYLKPSGGDEARLIQAMRRIGHNIDVDFQYAQVIQAPPSLKIRMESDGMEFSGKDVTVAECLTAHERKVTINGVQQTIIFGDHLKAGDRVIVACMDDKQQWFILDKAVTY